MTRSKYGPEPVFTKEIVYVALKSFMREHGYLPTYEELGKRVGCSWKTIHRRIHELAEDGLLELNDNSRSGRNFTIKSIRISFSDD